VAALAKFLLLKVTKPTLTFFFLENEGFLGSMQPIIANGSVNNDPSAFEHFRNNTHDQNRPSGRKQQALAHQKFGMTPFDQQNVNGQFSIDQKIEERESLRHSTHRSQRSDRVAAQ